LCQQWNQGRLVIDIYSRICGCDISQQADTKNQENEESLDSPLKIHELNLFWLLLKLSKLSKRVLGDFF
jgi:hypothetical protein